MHNTLRPCIMTRKRIKTRGFFIRKDFINPLSSIFSKKRLILTSILSLDFRVILSLYYKLSRFLARHFRSFRLCYKILFVYLLNLIRNSLSEARPLQVFYLKCSHSSRRFCSRISSQTLVSHMLFPPLSCKKNNFPKGGRM